MKGIITVLGKDKIGIIGKVCSFLSDKEINILDISQTIVSGFFNMVMIVDIGDLDGQFENLPEELDKLGESLGVKIKIQHEDIFNGMHRI